MDKARFAVVALMWAYLCSKIYLLLVYNVSESNVFNHCKLNFNKLSMLKVTGENI